MDIKLGKINVTHGQIANSNGLKSDVIKGFSLREDEVTVVATRELTEQEIIDLKASLSALPTERQKTEREVRLEAFKAKPVLTNAEIKEILELNGLI
jgi:hypothetical protein